MSWSPDPGALRGRVAVVVGATRGHHRGVEAIGPFPGWPSPYLELEDGRRVHARLDRNGYWQALVFEGRDVVRMADIDGSDWPGDPT